MRGGQAQQEPSQRQTLHAELLMTQHSGPFPLTLIHLYASHVDLLVIFFILEIKLMILRLVTAPIKCRYSFS